jgi:hypothetical protein
VGEEVFKDTHIDLLDGAADSGFTGEACFGRLEGVQEFGGMKGSPVGDGGSPALVVEHGGEDDGPDEGPFELLAACFARIRESRKHCHHTAILEGVHCLPPLSLVTPAIVNDGPAFDDRL